VNAAEMRSVLRRRFPDVMFWFGERTGSWWALMPPPAGWRLVEAADADELTRAIIEAQSWPWPSPAGGACWRRPAGDLAATVPVTVTSGLVKR
jgi:hypothetical protein